MALDGLFLSLIKKELKETLLGCKIDKIYEPSRDEIVLSFRGKGDAFKLMISADSSSGRIHLTENKIQNPPQPPMFCMLLRKHLLNYKLTDITQNGLDRVLLLHFEGINELGDSQRLYLIAELMGRFSNIILAKEDLTIIDSIKRVDFETSSVRQILPGGRYEFLSLRGKMNIEEESERCAAEKVLEAGGKGAFKAVMDSLDGFSPLVSRQVLKRAGIDENQKLSPQKKPLLEKEIGAVRWALLRGAEKYYVLKTESGIPKDFSFIPFEDIPEGFSIKEYASASELLEDFYEEKSRGQRLLQYSGDILKNIENKIGRTKRKLELQKEELRECMEKEEHRKKGELLLANIYSINKGDGFVSLDDYYKDPPEKIKIELDRRLSPSANAQKYFKEYSKLCEREKKLSSLIGEEEGELKYLESVKDELQRCENLEDVLDIKAELISEGYIRQRGAPQKAKKEKGEASLEKTISPSGFIILRGRNNVQNDLLTTKIAAKGDIWFHTHNIPGSHVVIKTEGKEPDDEAILTAALLAAKNSAAAEASKVPVDYTLIKNVKKPPSSKPGMVIYDSYKTLFVDPTEK